MTVNDAEQLCNAIRAEGDYPHVTVRAHRGYLYIHAGDEDPVARLTPLANAQFGLSYYNSHRRWEAMPFSGSIREMASTITTALGAYLGYNYFPTTMRESDH